MMGQYGLGVACAVLSGVMNACGAILQKNAVNQIPPDERAQGLMRRLVGDRRWVLGLAMSMGVGSALVLTAQSLIGPALVPGLSASGLVVLALASTRFIGEKLRPAEMLGVVSLVCGVALLGLSRLEIRGADVNLHDGALLLRLLAFSVGLALCCLSFLLASSRARDEARGLMVAMAASFLYCLSNLWILPLIVTIGRVFGGRADLLEGVLFVASCVMLVGTNAGGIRGVQEAYRFAPASKVQPIQQVSTQTVPILIYFLVFQQRAVGSALLFAPAGVALIVIGGFLVAGRRL